MRQMNSEPRRSDAAVAVSVIRAQAGIAVIAALVAYGVRGKSAAMGAAYGGLTALVPTIYFALRVFARRAADSPQLVVGAFFQAEIGKFALTAVMFAFGAMLLGKQFLALLATYVACLAAYWVVMASTALADTGPSK